MDPFWGSGPFEISELLFCVPELFEVPEPRAPELFEFLEALLQSLEQLQLPQVDG